MLNGSGEDHESGSVLMLMPAAILIVLVLGAIAVDMSVVYLGQRELLGAAGAAANDAVTVGIDEHALRTRGTYSLDPSAVEKAVADSLAASGMQERLTAAPTVVIDAQDTVRVVLSMDVDYVFARALPGGRRHRAVHATASASARQR